MLTGHIRLQGRQTVYLVDTTSITMPEKNIAIADKASIRSPHHVLYHLCIAHPSIDRQVKWRVSASRRKSRVSFIRVV